MDYLEIVDIPERYFGDLDKLARTSSVVAVTINENATSLFYPITSKDELARFQRFAMQILIGTSSQCNMLKNESEVCTTLCIMCNDNRQYQFTFILSTDTPVQFQTPERLQLDHVAVR